FSRIIGARGDDHTKEWPGAIIPALPQLVSSPTALRRSSSTTSWPSLRSWNAVVTPTTPPPRTRTRMPTSLGSEERSPGRWGGGRAGGSTRAAHRPVEIPPQAGKVGTVAAGRHHLVGPHQHPARAAPAVAGPRLA